MGTLTRAQEKLGIEGYIPRTMIWFAEHSIFAFYVFLQYTIKINI